MFYTEGFTKIGFLGQMIYIVIVLQTYTVTKKESREIWCAISVIHIFWCKNAPTSVVDPSTLNLYPDPDPGFWPNLDPDPG